MLIVMLGCAPASARPSVELAPRYALGATKFAATSGPGEFWYVALTRTSTRGTIYEPRKRTLVRNGSAWSHHWAGSQTLLLSLPRLVPESVTPSSISGSFE